MLRFATHTYPPLHAAGSYSTHRLRELFGRNFLVEDVILKDSRKKKKASALVVLDSIQAAGQAAHEVLGDLKNPLLVTPYLKVMPHTAAQDHEQQQQQPQAASAQGAAAGAAAAAAQGGSRQPAAPLFAAAAVGGGGGSSSGRPVQRPNKPLFPSKQLGSDASTVVVCRLMRKSALLADSRPQTATAVLCV